MRYAALITRALGDIQADPLRPGSHSRNWLADGVRTYHLELSRARVAGSRVKTPRHLIIYRVGQSLVQVLGVAHESSMLSRRLLEP